MRHVTRSARFNLLKWIHASQFSILTDLRGLTMKEVINAQNGEYNSTFVEWNAHLTDCGQRRWSRKWDYYHSHRIMPHMSIRLPFIAIALSHYSWMRYQRSIRLNNVRYNGSHINIIQRCRDFNQRITKHAVKYWKCNQSLAQRVFSLAIES